MANPATAKFAAGLSIYAPLRIGLTGTVFRNRPQDVWSQLKVTGLTESEAYREWDKRHAVDGVLRMTYEDAGIVLPPLHEHSITVMLTPQERAAYDHFEWNLETAVRAHAQERQFDTILAALTLLRLSVIAAILAYGKAELTDEVVDQLPLNGWDSVASSKVRSATEILVNAVTEGHKIIVFSMFKLALKLVHRSWSAIMPETPSFFFTGDVKDSKGELRRQLLLQFKNTEGPAVLFMTGQTGGEGLNITSATVGVLLEPHWTSKSDVQEMRRFWRIGQTKETHWYTLRAENTLEKFVGDMCDRKEHQERHLFGLEQQKRPQRLLDTLKAYFRHRGREPKAVAARPRRAPVAPQPAPPPPPPVDLLNLMAMDDEIEDGFACVVCLAAPFSVRCALCGQGTCCALCAPNVDTCPFCYEKTHWVGNV